MKDLEEENKELEQKEMAEELKIKEL